MRLSLCLLLIVLAVQCYETYASTVCYPVLRDGLAFILMSKEKLVEELQKYSAPPEAVKAKLKMKDCVDEMDYLGRIVVAGALAQILLECGPKALLVEKLYNLPRKK